MSSTGETRENRAQIKSGEHERHLATGALAQQFALAGETLIMLAVVTALARSLTLSEFGTYGLMVSIASYLLLVQTSVESAAVRAISLARDQADRDRAYSSAVLLYIAAGLLAGTLVAVGGWLLAGALGLPPRLAYDARRAAPILGAVILIGWPLRVSQDVLRGSHRFVDAAAAEVVGYAIFGAATISMVAAGSPLWLLIGVGGSIPALTGLAGTGVAVLRRLPYRFRRRTVDSVSIRQFANLSGYLFVGGATDLVIYALDRVLLAAYRNVATVGLYEGPVRVHNLVRSVHGALVGTVLPAASRFHALGDESRMGDLMLRGTRYVLVVTLPITISFMVFAKPLLTLWLGAKFGVASAALTILVSYWLINSNWSVAGTMLVALGHARWLARYAWQLAAFNLGLSVVLTWKLGLDGVVLGTTVPMFLMSPIFLSKVLATLPITLTALIRTVWIPAYATCVALAVVLLAVRLIIPINSLFELLAVLAAGPVFYWGVFYSVWSTPGERMLSRDLIRGAARLITTLGPRPS